MNNAKEYVRKILLSSISVLYSSSWQVVSEMSHLVRENVSFVTKKYNMERQNLLEVYLSYLGGDDVAKLNVLVQEAIRPLAK